MILQLRNEAIEKLKLYEGKNVELKKKFMDYR